MFPKITPGSDLSPLLLNSEWLNKVTDSVQSTHFKLGRRKRATGGGSSVTNTEWFGRVTTAIDGAIGWAVDDAGIGEVQEVDEDGDDVGDPKEVYSRYFNTVPIGTPVYCEDKGDGTHEFKHAGCSPGP